MSAIRPATDLQMLQLQYALKNLRDTRECLKVADCPRALAKLLALIKSVEGAERHMRHRLQRSDLA
jgi:hypothetical protein